MKRIVLLLSMLFVMGVALAQVEVTVSGIVLPTDMNGVYTQIGERNSRPYFSYTPDGSMNTYSIFYSDDPMLAGWIIYPGQGPGPDSGMASMWLMGDEYFLKLGAESMPPVDGYSRESGSMMPSLAGDPVVSEPRAIPVSMWAIVLVFALAGGFLVYRHYSKRELVA